MEQLERPIIIIVKHFQLGGFNLPLPLIKYPEPAPPHSSGFSSPASFPPPENPRKFKDFWIGLVWEETEAYWALGPVGGLVAVGLLRPGTRPAAPEAAPT